MHTHSDAVSHIAEGKIFISLLHNYHCFWCAEILILQMTL